MAWDAQGNLYLDRRQQHRQRDAGRADRRAARASAAGTTSAASANTNDLRGKILRIHPEPDGTYTIPPGNLFPPGTPGTRPEIYTMGHRNPWRVSIDSKTGYVYWGEVGPDASEDTRSRAARLRRAQPGARAGLLRLAVLRRREPRLSRSTTSSRIKPLAPKDPAKPTNTSVNNTGLRELPPAQPAFISYPYGVVREVPARSAPAAGPRPAARSIHRADFPTAPRAFPAYYEGKWLTADLSRGWIMAVTMDERRRLPVDGAVPAGAIGRRSHRLKFGPTATSTSSTTAAPGSRRATTRSSCGSNTTPATAPRRCASRGPDRRHRPVPGRALGGGDERLRRRRADATTGPWSRRQAARRATFKDAEPDGRVRSERASTSRR